MRHSLFALLFAMMPGILAADPPKVVADIAPIGAIVARVMAGVGTPQVLIPRGASPHDYAMRPSDARALASADLVVWVGPMLTGFLQGPLDALAGEAVVVTAMAGPVALLPFREGATFEPHSHGKNHGHDEGHEGASSAEPMDPHLWLSPSNAVAIAGMVADELARLDPENAGNYRQNLNAFGGEIRALEAEVETILTAVRDVRFIVLHDAFHYFEVAFGVEAAGAVMAGDAAAPGPARMSDLRAHVAVQPVVCALAEPQMDVALIETAIEGQEVRISTLDPMGDPDLPMAQQYVALIRTLAQDLAACLTAG